MCLYSISKAHPESVELLTEQYRMNDTIMSLCKLSHLWKYRMKCAKEVPLAHLTSCRDPA